MLSSSIVLAQRFVSITRRRTHLTAVYSSTRSPGINEIECYWRPKAFRTWNRIITWLEEMQTLRQIAACFTARPLIVCCLIGYLESFPAFELCGASWGTHFRPVPIRVCW